MSNASSARGRQRKAATRSDILQRAYEMYLSGELEPGNERLIQVLDSLGYTTGAAYQIWASQSEFRNDLNVFIAENIEYATLRTMAGNIAALAARGLAFDEHVLHAGDQYASTYLHREEFFLTLRFFAMAEDRPDEITAALRSAYQRSSWETEELFAAGLERFERRLKPPLQMGDLSAAIIAALEGLALRARVEPERVSKKAIVGGAEHHLFSFIFLAILRDFTEAVGS